VLLLGLIAENLRHATVFFKKFSIKGLLWSYRHKSGFVCSIIFLIFSRGKLMLRGTHVFPEINMGKMEEYISNDLFENVNIVLFLIFFSLKNFKTFKE
jgi:hypothetical protein